MAMTRLPCWMCWRRSSRRAVALLLVQGPALSAAARPRRLPFSIGPACRPSLTSGEISLYYKHHSDTLIPVVISGSPRRRGERMANPAGAMTT